MKETEIVDLNEYKKKKVEKNIKQETSNIDYNSKVKDEKIFYLDDDGNIVDPEVATKANILQFDENGQRIGEVYMVRNQEVSEEEAAKALEDIVVDPDDPIFKNATYYKNGKPVSYEEMRKR
jgi:hypothetical protein